MEIVEDEVHLILECTMHDNLRQQYKSLFSVNSLLDGSGHSSITFRAPTKKRFYEAAEPVSYSKIHRQVFADEDKACAWIRWVP